MPTIFAIRVEGLGKPAASAADKRYRYCTSPMDPANDSGGLYIRAMDLTVPPEVSFGVDFLGGRSTIGGLRVDLLALPTIRQHFYRSDPQLVAQLTVGVDADDTSFSTDTSGLAGTTVVIGTEVVYLVSEGASGVYSVTRGVLGSLARPHGSSGVAVDGTVDTAIYSATAGGAMATPGRKIDLLRVDSDGTYADEVVLWAGVINDVDLVGGTVVQLSCNGALDLLQGGRICRDLWRGDLVDQGVTAPDRSWAYHDRRGGGTSVRSVAVAADSRTLYSWGGSALVSDAAPGTNSNSAVLSDDGDPILVAGSPPIDWGSPPKSIWCAYSTHPSAPDLDASGSRLSPNLAVLTLQLLTTSASGVNYDVVGGAASYDLGIEDLGLGIPWSLVDVAGIEALAERLGGGLTPTDGGLLYRPHIHLGLKSADPVDVYALLAPEWHALGCVLTEGRGGQITVVDLGDDADLDAVEITVDQVIDDVAQSRRMVTVDRVLLEWNNAPGVGTRTDKWDDVFNAQRSLIPRQRDARLSAPGLANEAIARLLSAVFVQRWRLPIPPVTLIVTADVDLWPGQAVRVTHPVIVDADGTFGVTASTMLVVGRSVRLEAATATYQFLDVGAIYDRRAKWAPSGRVSSAPTSTSVVLVQNYVTSGNGVYADDIDAIAAAADLGTVKCDILHRTDCSLVTAGLTVSSVNTGTRTITFTGAHGATATDFVVLSSYDEQVADNQDAWASMADDGRTLGAAGDAGHQWGL